jgi:hypothetical protein
MNDKKHTPGPWKKCGGYTPEYCAVHSDKGYIVFKMADKTVDKVGGELIDAPDFEEQQANARLIAEAPMLLETLETVQEVLKIVRGYMPKSPKNPDTHTFELCSVAVCGMIRKAKGGTL